MGTKKFLGIKEGHLINHEPVLCVGFDKIRKSTKFCLWRTPYGSYMLQVPHGGHLFAVKAIDYVDCPAAALLPEKLYLRCKKVDEDCFTDWFFKIIKSESLMSYGSG